MGRQAGGTDAVCEPHAAEDFHGAGIAPLHLGKELRCFLLLDERAAHAAQPEIDREGQPDRTRADDENLGVDHGDLPGAAGQSGLAPENLTTLPHFSVSSAMSFPKSAGEPGSIVPPKSASRAFISGSARATLISMLSLAMISEGVFLGAPTPYHVLASYPGNTSATVGRSGNT